MERVKSEYATRKPVSMNTPNVVTLLKNLEGGIVVGSGNETLFRITFSFLIQH